MAATTTIGGLPAVTSGNLTGAALAEVEDATSNSAKSTLAQLRTNLLAGGSGFTATDPLVIGTLNGSAPVIYPVVTGETSVTTANTVYPYGEVRRTGALGDGTTDDRTAFAGADTNAVAGKGTGGVVLRGGGLHHRVASNLTITSPIQPQPGTIVKPDNGVVLTLGGHVEAGRYQWLDTSAGGSVQLKRGAARRIYPEWFGADPTGTNDSTTALQAAFDTAIASNLVLGAVITVVLSGTYKTTNSLHGFSWSAGAFSFCTFHIEGQKGYIGGKMVEIVPTFTDRPVLILQAVRSLEITGVTFTGALPSVSPSYMELLHDTGGSAGSPWYNSGNVGRDQRYSPYCAIAIDPFSAGGVPSDGGIPGHSAFYTQNIGSSVVTIDSCTMRQFIVAAAIGISNGSLQCDSITLKDCVVENAKVAVATGHSQTRNVNVINIHALYARVMFDVRSYGVGGGDMMNVVGGLVAGGCKWLMLGGGAFGPGTIKQFYAESIWSLGQWLGPFPLTFDDCHLNPLPSGFGGNASSHLDNAGPVIFRGGFFGFFNNVYGRQSINGGAVTFDGCMLSGEPVTNRLATLIFRRAGLRWSGAGTVYGVDHEFRENFIGNASNAEAILGSMGCVHENMNGTTTDYRRLRWREYENDITLDSAAVITVVVAGDGSTTATLTSASMALKAQVGDVVCAVSNASFKIEKFLSTDADVQPNGLAIGTVSSIVGSAVTLQDVPNGVTSGTYDTFLKRLPRFRPRTVGITTSGSNVVASVAPPPTMWPVGARIQGTTIPAGTYVTAVSVGSSTITLSQNATGSGTAEVYDVKMIVEHACMSAKPTYEVWFAGDVVENIAGTKDANNMIPERWRCTVSGRGDATAPAATFETMFGSTVTPAT